MRTTIAIDESRLNTALTTINAGRLSAHYLNVVRVPDYATTLAVVVKYKTDQGEDAAYAAPCNATSTAGKWTCYIIPAAFPHAGEYCYDVVGYNADAAPVWLGRGRLAVHENPAAGQGEIPSIIPADTYVRNPVTGLYHLVSAVVDDEGNVTLNVAEEGIER